MKNKAAWLRTVISLFLCGSIFLFCEYYFLFSEKNKSANFLEKNNQSIPLSQIEKTNTKSKIQENTELEKAVETGTKGTVLGGIKEKFISPYSAPQNYKKVYLKNNTDCPINIADFLNGELPFKLDKTDDYQVLIIHTHATETYMKSNSDTYTSDFSSRTRDNEYNMVKMGEIITEKLNKAGIKTLHDKTQHDYPEYNGSYSRAANTICSYLEKYKSIKIVLDIHRDAVGDNDGNKIKLVTEIEGKKAAQVMIVMGSNTGSVTNFPNWQENLKLAVKLQQTLESEYPTLARPLSLMSKNYNESLTTGSLLVEIGTDGNTVEEAKYSSELVGKSLVKLFKKLK